MVLELKLRKIGNSVGIVLPREALTHLNVGEGDTVCVTDAAGGSLRLSPGTAESRRQLEAAQNVIRFYRNALRELSK
ncbi:MAG: AbrB family transcriptional regulator [Acidobacteria bacterium RIFCSPLOWO2_02_FULL_65_29]|nr:MAG: AbrB family transcriptional regulator [Acidobacteria bacterium RIFCSPLOWO2_02_FULL_65_29]